MDVAFHGRLTSIPSTTKLSIVCADATKTPKHQRPCSRRWPSTLTGQSLAWMPTPCCAMSFEICVAAVSRQRCRAFFKFLFFCRPYGSPKVQTHGSLHSHAAESQANILPQSLWCWNTLFPTRNSVICQTEVLRKSSQTCVPPQATNTRPLEACEGPLLSRPRGKYPLGITCNPSPYLLLPVPCPCPSTSGPMFVSPPGLSQARFLLLCFC